MTKFEKAGYRLCEIRNEDPEEMVSYPHPKGYAVAMKNLRYKVYSRQLEKQYEEIQALIFVGLVTSPRHNHDPDWM